MQAPQILEMVFVGLFIEDEMAGGVIGILFKE
jgi:hypothetical protein